ncbi:Methyl-accepting chemotaxis protein [Devosia sp. DBB001]|nr:Methyl-accepting chemotaxis protein [Devosia sp. DBB001]
MADSLEQEYADTLEVEGDTKSSARVLAAIKKAERAMNAWQALCDRIDEVYSRSEQIDSDWADPDYDLFWASMEIMKPAVYAHPPVPVVSPQFKDRRPLMNVTAELLERSAISGFERGGIDEAMICTRDDLIFYNRGQIWVTYETDERGGGQRICPEHLDRKDFLYPPARKWSDVPWVARRAWLTRTEMRKRFAKRSGDAYKDATLCAPANSSEYDGAADNSRKAGVWEVWHKADNRVYWVAEGVSVMLDESEPHLKLRGFFPCPRPAFGTLRPRTLVPVPDYTRYAGHFKKINQLTARIYALLDMVRMKGLIPAGGDIGTAVEQVMRDNDDHSILIPVPGAALLASGGAASFVQWLPLADIASAITGLIEARRELFSDYDRLSGISDIMRGETQAEETYGAQRLKSQYGSVRVRDKIDELQRIARDVTEISAEIMAENFSKETLLEMSQMEIPTKAEIAKQVDGIEALAEKELKGVKEQARKMAEQAQQQGQQIDPAQAEQQFQQAQQQVIAKYTPMLKQASEQVPIEDVMKLLRDDKARGFAFEIATDSTVLTDEMEEKASRSELLAAFASAMQQLLPLFQLGPAGVNLAGEMLKFALQPYRVGRTLNAAVDELIASAPQMAQAMADQKGGGQDDGLAAAQMELAKAEMAKVESQTQANQANAQLKMQELELKAAEAQTKAQQDSQRFQLELAQTRGNLEETNAQIKKIYAEIQKLGVDASNQTRQQDREDIRTASDIQGQQQDRAVNAQQTAISNARADRGEDCADRQQQFAERQPAE